ncbi:bifunctional 4-hydroxy-2-oxoglutarate aldolase/2-dehydro-3-deoxy-phosphogluconate aldolase [Salinisphaera sp.]|uniref:bifunctional 4-hydroxy-2-oxoglutarate aldolase/2-dehydro-3-deoxy-phosphogluconate aldolase n=1 Tax=Salinisphaera sp. TaxID=1914330 RepID=UPI002D769735|nr:bifunctional 4-hydroxy-2-oxoglutarate aldolase/2-dehydro-3-deoxy-phosphogluconate aldolase [Salinisphaera sp.]HET7314416.1 bifunctional 4-hydroxy-2-oxoglutarate aldolase/2-dehydro-3-deoxy-phosphogluconate aldolase [Salinisphaera sp.]
MTPNAIDPDATTEIGQTIAEIGIVPVIAIDDEAQAAPLAETLVSAGLPIAEITFRTPAAAGVIKAMRAAAPDLLVGAGTVLFPQEVDVAVEAGAQFALAPGLVPSVVDHARSRALPFFPGVMTPSDIGSALSLGITTMKFFPAGPAGGPDMLKALAAPHAHCHPRFIPTGGIGAADIETWLRVGVVDAIGGSWIARRDAIREGRWQTIHDNASAAVESARRVREQQQ